MNRNKVQLNLFTFYLYDSICLILVWQHPYVNVFKHLDVASWKKATKEGEVNAIMVWYFEI